VAQEHRLAHLRVLLEHLAPIVFFLLLHLQEAVAEAVDTTAQALRVVLEAVAEVALVLEQRVLLTKVMLAALVRALLMLAPAVGVALVQ
jgi:hypothetical protein